MDILTALGWGIEEVWSKMLKQECGIKPLVRFPQQKYLTDFAGEISPELETQLGLTTYEKQGNRAYDLAKVIAKKVLKEGHQKLPHLLKKDIGLILSTTRAEMEGFERLCRQEEVEVSGYFNPFSMAKALADELGLGGPVYAVSCACASGLVAIIQGMNILKNGMAKGMIILGVDVLSDFVLAGFSSLSALSKHPCKPYDESRDGLSLGEGVGGLLLARGEEAREGALAEIKGGAVTNDANHITAPSKDGGGLSRAISQLMESAGFHLDEISYINGHGTGTVYNDEMEFWALHKIFGESMPPISSMKGYFGHTLGAAGVVETALSVQAMLTETIPASLGFQKARPGKFLNVAKDQIPLGGAGKVIVIKSGFGGINGALGLGGVSK